MIFDSEGGWVFCMLGLFILGGTPLLRAPRVHDALNTAFAETMNGDCVLVPLYASTLPARAAGR